MMIILIRKISAHQIQS